MKIKLYILLLSLIFVTPSYGAPINNECAINPNHPNKDCPNDPLHALSYEMDYMNFGYAWDKSYGTARVAILENRIKSSMPYSNEFGPRIRRHASGSFKCNNNGLRVRCTDPGAKLFSSNHITIPQYPLIYPDELNSSIHGDLILSLFGAIANNSIGMSSICRECTLALFTAGTNEPTVVVDTYYEKALETEKSQQHQYRALKAAILGGNQVINKSGGWATPKYYDCDQQNSLGYEQSVCDSLRLAKDRDVVIVASAGNSGYSIGMNWPANEADYVIGVGGTDRYGRIWDETNYGGCPIPNSIDECGTQYGGGPFPIMAPAKNVVVYHSNGSYNPGLGCFDGDNDGYQGCSGTSFSAPIISGVVAILRSMNPLLSFDEIQYELAHSRVFTDEQNRTYSIPNTAQLLKKKIFGFSNGVRIANRLKPMFRLNGRFYRDGIYKNNYLSTSIPQVAISALEGYYLRPIEPSNGKVKKGLSYITDSTEPLAVGYPKFRRTNYLSIPDNARAPFYIFGGHENPFTGADDMIPLYHFGYEGMESNDPQCYDLADHAYGTQSTTAFNMVQTIKCPHTDSRFVLEGIEGYLLPSCPDNMNCYKDNKDANSPQCLMVRYSEVDDSYALLMESELNKAKFSTYTTIINHLSGMSNSECLGYIFPNVDSDNDLMIDGTEYILGTNPHDKDSDNDAVNDGVEYPPTSPVVSDPMDPASK